MKKLGFMQGRLVPAEDKKIQSFPWKNWKKEFEISNKLGLDLIEWTIDRKKFFQNPINTNIGRKEINKLKKKYKIKLDSVTADFFMQSPFFKNNLKTEIEILKTFIINCSKLRIKYIICPLVDNSSIETKFQEKNLIDSLLKINSLILKKKLKILFESDYSPIKLKNFITKFPKKTFGINYDSGNSAGLGFNFEEEKQYFSRVKNIHIKDKKYKSSSVKIGRGEYDFNKLLKYLQRIKYKGNFIFQTARNRDNIKMMKHNLNFFNKLF
jgi:L-ribulose-5-phosphate 3-epimerase